MPETPSTYRTITPYLIVPDAERELAFLRDALGAVEQSIDRRPDGAIMHAELRVGDSLLMLAQGTEQWPPRPAAFYLWVSDVDATYNRALAAGATSESTPEDKPYGHRNAGVIDPAGLTWWIAAPVRA